MVTTLNKKTMHQSLELLNSKEWTYLTLASPIDFNWNLGLTLNIETLQQRLDPESPDESRVDPKDILFLFQKSHEVLGRYCDRENDTLRGLPRLLAFPGDNTWIVLGFCFKVDNNGTTVIAIPPVIGDSIAQLLNAVVHTPVDVS